MINTSEFSKRLQKVIAYYEETASSFSEKISVQRSSISHILSGRNKPSLDFVMKILNTYPEIDLYWLIDGRGNFPSTSTSTSTSKTEIPQTELKFSESHPEPKTELTSNSTDIDKIIIFYKNGSFKSYQN